MAEHFGVESDHPLKRFRTARGLSMQALGDAVGVSKQTISRIESGEDDPSLALIRRIVAFADGALSANDFLHAPERETETRPS